MCLAAGLRWLLTIGRGMAGSVYICKVFVNGQPCGYVAQGKDAKEAITDLHKHQESHLPPKDKK